MPNFVYDDTDLDYPKAEKKPVPNGQGNKHLKASEWNTTNQALVDVKNILRGATLYGLAPQAERPEVEGVDNFVWVNDDGQLVLTIDGTDTPLGEATPDNFDIGGVGTEADPLALKGASVGFVTAKSLGVVADGVTDERAVLAAAIVTSGTLGARLELGEGTIVLGRHSSNSWCIDTNGQSNVTIQGVKGKTFLKMAPGMPNASISLIRVNGGENITIRDVVLDGNWGNAATYITGDSNGDSLPQATINVDDTSDFPASGTFEVVVGANDTQTITYSGKTDTTFTGCTGGTGVLRAGNCLGILDSNTGLNHTTQADPKSHLLMIRGARNVLVQNVHFRDAYGDFIWTGFQGTPDEDADLGCKNIQIVNCTGRVCARNAFSIGQSVDGITMRDCDWRYVFQTAFDTEPQGNNQAPRRVLADNVYFGLWWNPANPAFHLNQAVSIVGGNALGLLDANAARNYRFINCTIEGNVALEAARGVLLHGCTHIIDFDHGAEDGVSYAPIMIDHLCDHIEISSGDIYDRGKFVDGTAAAGDPHNAAIVVNYYTLLQPATIKIKDYRIRARNGLHGVKVSGGGAGAFGTTSGQPQRASLHTSTGISSSSISCTGAGWGTNEKIGWEVRRGGLVATVESNTSDTLTLAVRTPSGTAWNRPTGGIGPSEATPAGGVFTLTSTSGILTIDGLEIDCSDDGNGQGGYGVALYGELSGGRVRILDTNVKNANGHAIHCEFSSSKSTPLLEIADCTAHDDQPVVTCDSVVHFVNGTDGIDKLILRNNIKTGGVRRAYSGLTSGVWLEEDGDVQRWTGYGDPEDVVRAPIGSTFRRKDGGTGTTLYVKEENGSAIDAQDGAGSSTVSVTNGNTTTMIGATTTVDACLAVNIFAAQPGSGSSDWDTITNADLVNLTEIFQETSIGTILVVTGEVPLADTYGTTSIRNNAAATQFGPCSISAALRPEAPGVVPVFVAAGTRQTDTGGGTVTVPWPGSEQEGDVGLLIVENLEPDAVTPPADWVELTESPQIGAFTAAGSQLRVYERRAHIPSMPSTNVTYTGAHIQAVILVFRGASLADATGWDAK